MAPRPFSITTTSTIITLDDDLRAEAAFTVLNQTGQPVRARAIVAPEAPLDPAWFQLEGSPERDFPPAGAEQYLVDVTIPAGTAAGQYRFRVDAVAADRGDEEATAGPSVVFDVPYVEVILPVEPRGYLRTWLGSLIGALPGAIVGGIVGGLVGRAIGEGWVETLPDPAATPPADFGEAIGEAIARGLGAGIGVVFVVFAVALIGLLVGVWLAVSIGSWLALRMGRYPTPWKTILPLAVVFPFSTFAILFLVGLILSADLPGIVALIVVLLAVLGILSVPALAGRAFYRWRTTGGL